MGVPMDVPESEGQAAQPNLCTIDQEIGYGPAQMPGGMFHFKSWQGLSVFSLDGLPTAMQRGIELARASARGYRLPLRNGGNNCGVAPLTCQIDLSTGNLLVSIILPSAGSSSPPLRFFYNSLSTQDGEYGFGWTGLYRQRVAPAASSSSSSSPAV